MSSAGTPLSRLSGLIRELSVRGRGGGGVLGLSRAERIWQESISPSLSRFPEALQPAAPPSPGIFHFRDRSLEEAASKWRLEPGRWGGGWLRVAEANGGVVKSDEWQMAARKGSRVRCLQS